MQCPRCGGVLPIDKTTYLRIKNGLSTDMLLPSALPHAEKVDPFGGELSPSAAAVSGSAATFAVAGSPLKATSAESAERAAVPEPVVPAPSDKETNTEDSGKSV